MRRSRFSAVLVATAMALGGTALLAGPAEAATSSIQISIDSKTTVKAAYGDYIGGVDGTVTGVGDQGQALTADAGQVDLEALYPGKDWVVVATDTDPGYLYFENAAQKAKGNVQYRVHYYGGTGHDANYDEYPMPAAYSNVVTVRTFWKLTTNGGLCRHHKCPLSGNIKPKTNHVKVLLQRRKHGNWTKLQAQRTNRRGQFHFAIRQQRNKGFKLRVIVKGTKNISAAKSETYHIGPF